MLFNLNMENILEGKTLQPNLLKFAKTIDIQSLSTHLEVLVITYIINSLNKIALVIGTFNYWKRLLSGYE